MNNESSKQNPRKEIWELVNTNIKALLKESGKLHGHYCPYLAYGVRAGPYAIKKMKGEHKGMEEVLAIVETNNCFSDGIQYSTGCTFGNNSLIYRDYGKTAFSLVNRDGEGIRVSVRSEADEIWSKKYPKYMKLFGKVVGNRDSNEREMKEMMRLSGKISFEVLDIDFEKIFKVEETSTSIPEYAPIHESVMCESCGEKVMSTKAVEIDGKKFCKPCAGESFYELDGSGIKERNP